MLNLIDMAKKVTRLYQQFVPENYQLALQPDSQSLTFTGSVTIKGKKVGRPSQRLTFHQKDLKITKAEVIKHDRKGDTAVDIVRINHQRSFDEVRLHADSLIYPGDYTIKLEFEGQISRQMNGIYPSYFMRDSKQKILIATQFESHHAREAFPSIDEPEAKATFQLSLTTPTTDVVLSNTPVHEVAKTADEHLKLTTFETTPRMSTYLLAFVCGDLEFTEATTKDGVLVRAYATPENVRYTDFALKTAVDALEFYNQYFDIPYPLAKCDLVALPDFASGAMENWGLMTFREQALLVDPLNTSLNLKQYVATVVAHELTHQWFGNLVTMRWWTDLWLNESFASWMSYLAIDQLFPEWKLWTQFMVDEQAVAFSADALANTHPIEVTINHPDEIRTIFDAISYEKGSSVLMMLHEYLGATIFRDGLRLYLKRHAYGNTDTVDLWTALEEVSKLPVKDFMSAWTSQSGYPIVHATIGADRLELKQERFYLNSLATKDAATWPIPLLASEDVGITTLDTANLVIDNVKPSSSFIINHNQTSFFRTVYDPQHLSNLVRAIKAGQLNELERFGLLSDAFEAAKAGYGETTAVLKLLAAYADEDSAIVWDVIAAGIGALRTVMDEEVREALKPLVVKLVAKQLHRLGWDKKPSDSHFDLLLRPTILGLASFGEEPTVVAKAKQLFDDMNQPEDLNPDIRAVVYGTVARTGGKAEFDKLVSLHNHCTHSEERVTLSGALTGFKQPELIDQALAMITTDDVRLQDTSYWIAYSFMNRHARLKTWDWLVANWQWLSTNLGTDLSFSRMPIYASRGFSDKDFLPTFKKFFATHMSPAFERPVKQAIEIIEWQAAWKERDNTSLKKYLKG